MTSAVAIVMTAIVAFSCSDNDPITPRTPSEILASTPWETTGAKNEKGENVALDNPDVVGSVGFAYFMSNGKFEIFSLQDAPRIQGDWTVTPDGKTRTLVAKNASDKVLFTRDVQITVLTSKEFTYRLYPNANDRSKYVDIIHTPTNHKKPEFIFTPSQILSSTAWETTGAKDQTGANVALDNANVSGFVGFAYHNTNGTFAIYSLTDVLRMQGDWSISNEGGVLTRTLVAKNPDGSVRFTRTVPITVLTTKEFTYRTYPTAGNTSVYIDIIHTPTDHKEPAQ